MKATMKRNDNKSDLADRLNYQIPRIRLALLHEGSTTSLFAIHDPTDVEQYLSPLKFLPEEQFVAVHGAKNEIVGIHEVSHGTLSSSLVHPREVFKAACVGNSHAIIVAHNHPSGSKLEPSSEDMQTTRQLIAAGKLLGISVLDHLIMSPNQEAYSIRENHPTLWK